MTILGMVDYGLIVLFFVGVVGLILLTARTRVRETVPQAVLPPREAKGAYAFLAVLLVLLIALAFVAQREQARAASM